MDGCHQQHIISPYLQNMRISRAFVHTAAYARILLTISCHALIIKPGSLMRTDFVPWAESNPDGGRFGVPEGDNISAPIATLIGYFATKGAMVGVTRDYHPFDHASFLSQGGPFPSHCVQGGDGAKLRPVVAAAVAAAMSTAGQDRVFIAFKAMHEDVDSFGALPYYNGGKGRIANKAAVGECGLACQMGCAAAPWTGSFIMKQSAIRNALANGEVQLPNPSLPLPSSPLPFAAANPKCSPSGLLWM